MKLCLHLFIVSLVTLIVYSGLAGGKLTVKSYKAKYPNTTFSSLNTTNAMHLCCNETAFINNETSLSTNISVSWLDEFTENSLKHSIPYSLLMAILYGIVFLVGIIGNVVVVVVIAVKSHMRTVTNLFLLNLAVADIFVLVFCLPATLIAGVIRSWILGSFMCWGVAYVQGVSVVASAYSLAAISIDRCKAICKLTTTTQGFSQRQAKIVILFIWILAVFLPLPWAFVFTLQVSGHLMICSEDWGSEKLDIFYYIFGNLFLCYILPFLLILSANVKIWVKVSTGNRPNQSQRNRRRGVGKMLGVVTLTYLISWLPLYILATRVKILDAPGETENNFLLVVIPLTQWLAYFNSCINPIFYAFFNSNFRKMGRRFFPSWLFNRFSIRRSRSSSRCERRATLILKQNNNKLDEAKDKIPSVGSCKYSSSIKATHVNPYVNGVLESQDIQKRENSFHQQILYDDSSSKGNLPNKSLLCQTRSVKITAV